MACLDAGYRSCKTSLHLQRQALRVVPSTVRSLLACSLFIAVAPNTHAALGDAWVTRNALPTSAPLRSIVRTNTTFLAVGKHGAAHTSTDGSTWTQATTGTQANLNGVVWTGAQAIAVGDDGTILTSSDGSAWTARRSPQSSQWKSIVWTGNKAIVVGDAGAIATSDDGITWRTSFVGALQDLRAVAANGGTLITVGSQGFIAHSSDGLVWTSISPITSEMLHGIASNTDGSLWVAVGDNGTVLTSTNGSSWSGVASGSSAMLQHVLWDGAQFIASSTEGAVLTSNNGSTWTSHATGTTDDLACSAAGGGVTVAVGDRGVVMTSANNGTSWSVAHSGVRSSLHGIAQSNGVWAAVGNNGAITTSPDSIVWSAASSGAVTTLNSIAGNGSKFIAVGDGGLIRQSSDGTAWSAATSPTTRHLRAVVAGASNWVAVGANGTIVMSSNNGASWSTQSSGTSSQLRGVAYSGSMFVAIGESGVITTSTNGTSWTLRSSGVTEALFSVAWDGSTFIAVGDHGTVLASSDGTSWTEHTPPLSGMSSITLRSIVWSGVEFVAVGTHGSMLEGVALVLTSFDGTTWVQRAIEGAPALDAITVNGADILAAGSYGAIVYNVQSALPSVAFALASSSFAENAGTVQVTVTLDSASAGIVRVPFVVAGSAEIGASKDATISASPLTIPPGQTTATISITINNDLIDEGDETIIFDLTSPVGAIPGSQHTHTLTITDNDTAPGFTSLPASRVVAMGEAVQLTPAFIGDPVLKYQWSRNNVNLSGATASSYLLPAITLAQAGAYRVKATNLSGTATSNPATEIAVVDATNKVFNIVNKNTATFTVNAAGNGTITYQWTKDSVPLTDDTSLAKRITGSLTKTLTVKALTSADSGLYRCTVTTPVGQRDAGANTLNVIIPPVVHVPTFGGYVVSEAISVPILADNSPTKFSVSGLPSGVTYNSTTGVISGRSTVASTTTPFQVKITASNAAGTSPQVIATMTVAKLTDGTTGTYVGTIDRHAGLNAMLGGRVTFTIPGTGAASASIQLGTSSFSFVKALDVSAITSPSLTTIVKRTSKPDLTVHYDLDPGTGVITGSFTDSTGTANFSARRALVAPFTAWSGYYTSVLKLADSNDVGRQAIPQGHGYASFTVSSSGGASGSARLADGTTFSFSSPLRNNQAIVIYAPLYSNTGSLLGKLELASGTPVLVTTSELTWSKGTTNVRNYRNGFDPLALNAVGARYTTPGSGVIVMGVTPSPDNVPNIGVNFAEGGAPDPANRMNIQFRLTAPAARDLQTPAVNPAKISIGGISPSSGLFTGSFSLSDLDTTVTPNKWITRTTSYYGIIARDIDGILRGFGHFNLPMMPQNAVPPTTTISTSPILSGKVEMVPVPVP